MNLDDIPLFSMLRGRMSYLSERQRVIAENVANADTPGYQARDLKPFSFESQMSGFGGASGGFGGQGQLPMAASQPGHIAMTPPSFGPTGISAANMERGVDSETTLDGNGVVLEEEMMKMTEARMDYDAAVGFYQKALGLLRMAARAPGR